MLVDDQDFILAGLSAWQIAAICSFLLLLMIATDSNDS
tara:strand:- start:1316 stop:1429 length:114 start_codon:yes stop_codon:yes gene_type:complete